MVRRFHERFNHPVRHTPAVPSDDEVRFRLLLILEEFTELLSACMDLNSGWKVEEAIEDLRHFIKSPYPYAAGEVELDMVEAYDALLDMAFVIEGTHAVLGTRSEPGMREVYRANMDKEPAQVESKDAAVAGLHQKPKKPEGWTPPNHEEVLKKQGWVK